MPRFAFASVLLVVVMLLAGCRMCDTCYPEGPVVGTPYADARYHGPRSGSEFAALTPQPEPNLIPESMPPRAPAEETKPDDRDDEEDQETIQASFQDIAPGDSLKKQRFRR